MAGAAKYEEWLTEAGLTMIEGWARDGLSLQQIAKNIGVSDSTFRRWKEKYQLIRAAIKKGAEPVDYQVENAMLRSALGYREKVRKPVKLKTKKQLKDKGTIEEERIEYVEEEIYIKPDITAQIFWLKNRRPDKWRDRQERVVTTVEDLTPLAEMINDDTDTDNSMATAVNET